MGLDTQVRKLLYLIFYSSLVVLTGFDTASNIHPVPDSPDCTPQRQTVGTWRSWANPELEGIKGISCFVYMYIYIYYILYYVIYYIVYIVSDFTSFFNCNCMSSMVHKAVNLLSGAFAISCVRWHCVGPRTGQLVSFVPWSIKSCFFTNSLWDLDMPCRTSASQMPLSKW